MTWNPVPGAISYVLYRAAAPGVDAASYASLPGGTRQEVAATRYVDGGAARATLHHYAISAVGAGGEGSTSSVVAATPFRRSGWRWLTPATTGDVLYAIAAIDETTVWAVGPHGTIVHTRDGGETWSHQDGGSLETLYGVSFADATRGWIVGACESHACSSQGWSGPVILRTDDGGATWASQASATDQPLFAVAAVDANTAWAVGGGGVALHTVDGGSTWERRQLGIGALTRVQFLDEATGFAASRDTVFRTRDGGATWTPVQLPAAAWGLRAMDFVTADVGWAALGSPWFRDDLHFNGVVSTTNAGASWSASASFIPNDIAFFDRWNGWAAGFRGQIWRTSNGGGAWSLQETGTSYPELHDLVATGPSSAWAVGQAGTVLRTDDGGATWRDATRRVAQNLAAGAFVDPSTAWAIGHDGMAYRSVDGGITWSGHRYAPATSAFSYNAIVAADANRAWITGNSRGTIVRTVDGGVTWSVTELTAAPEAARVSFANGSSGWAWTSAGAVYRTTDGGATWAPVATGTALRTHAILDLGGGAAWIAGEAGMLRKTTNGGATWSAAASETLVNLWTIVAGDANTLWVSGFSWGSPETVVVSSKDAGATWTSEVRDFTVHAAHGPKHAWAMSYSQHVATRDGGTTWEVQGEDPPAVVPQFFSADIGFGFSNVGFQTTETGGF